MSEISGSKDTASASPLVAAKDKDKDGASSRDMDSIPEEDDNDSASMLSSSSRSGGASGSRFKGLLSTPSLRRRVTESSHKSRRLSSAASDEDAAAALGTAVGLAIQDAAKEGGSWGVGDELRMGLE
jgi:hypothetical protein